MIFLFLTSIRVAIITDPPKPPERLIINHKYGLLVYPIKAMNHPSEPRKMNIIQRSTMKIWRNVNNIPIINLKFRTAFVVCSKALII